MTADPMQRAREMLAAGLDDIAAANIRKHGDDARLSVAVPHALNVIGQLVEAIDEASDALDRLTTVSAHMLNRSDEVRQMAASPGGFWAQRAINAERQRDALLTREEEVRERCARIVDEHGEAWGLSYRTMTDALAAAIRADREGVK